jgi:hypothetical protein
MMRSDTSAESGTSNLETGRQTVPLKRELFQKGDLRGGLPGFVNPLDTMPASDVKNLIDSRGTVFGN